MAALLFLVLLLSFRLAASDPAASERSALLSFLSQTPHESRLRWPPSAPTCSWTGVTCDPSNSTVVALRLPAVGLVGPIPPRTLSLLPSLRILSLHSNRLSGAVPSDFANLSSLHSLYLQENQLAGPFPAAIPSLTRLTRLDLSGNDLSGQIPFAVNNLTKLTRLLLQSNRFDGPIPSISLPNLAAFNVSFNSLNGSIPETLDGFPASSFAGNLALCGPPLPPCAPFFPPSPAPAAVASPPPRRKHKLSTAAIVAIAVAGGGILIILLLLLLICCVFKSRRRRSKAPAKPPPPAAVGAAPRSGDTGLTSSSKDEMSGGVSGEGGEKNRLVFVGQGGGYSFDLEDLLRASAEVLGKGSVGTSYKAVLEEGTTVVVKRLKDVVVSKREFEQHMEGIGRVAEHRNVLPLRAYYYSKDEKLLVFDYLAAGSLSSLLHGSRGSGRTPLDWDNRMRVALAAGRGLAHLHTSAHLVHGNVKASNVLLRPDLSASALSDSGLTPLFGSSAPPNRVAGYRAPEVLETRRPTLKSDVYSFGVLLLELLTGKAPNQASIGDDGIDLPRWVQSVVREEWTAEVFDVELMRYANIEEEMVQLLQIAMACVATVPDSRPDIGEVVRMMEEIRAEGGDEGLRASSDDPSKTGSGGPTPPAAATP